MGFTAIILRSFLQAAWERLLPVPQSAASLIIPHSHSYSFREQGTWVLCLLHAYRASRVFKKAFSHYWAIQNLDTQSHYTGEDKKKKRSALLSISFFLSLSLSWVSTPTTSPRPPYFTTPTQDSLSTQIISPQVLIIFSTFLQFHNPSSFNLVEGVVCTSK